jgi:hypothetical protein
MPPFFAWTWNDFRKKALRLPPPGQDRLPEARISEAIASSGEVPVARGALPPIRVL